MIESNMISKTARSIFMLLSSLEACNSRRELTGLGGQLMGIARRAYAVQNFRAVEEVGKALSSNPFDELFQGAGDFYRALSLNCYGRGDAGAALPLYLRAAEAGDPGIRARALVGAGVASAALGGYGRAGEFYSEALALSVRNRTLDAVACSQAIKCRAVLDSIAGDHDRALEKLERGASLLPSVFALYPAAAFDYQNSRAVELAQCGRFKEARAVIAPVIASPFARFQPGWHDTAREIEALDPPVPTGRVYMPSVIRILPDNVIELKTHMRERQQEPDQAGEDDGYMKDIEDSQEWEQERARTPESRQLYAPAMKRIRRIQQDADREVMGGPDSEAG